MTGCRPYYPNKTWQKYFQPENEPKMTISAMDSAGCYFVRRCSPLKSLRIARSWVDGSANIGRRVNEAEFVRRVYIYNLYINARAKSEAYWRTSVFWLRRAARSAVTVTCTCTVKISLCGPGAKSHSTVRVLADPTSKARLLQSLRAEPVGAAIRPGG
jgi:hypothetical protein